jgi:hypothetical protein
LTRFFIRARRLAAAARLGFAPFQIFAQRQPEPVLPRLLLWMFALAFVGLILHCRLTMLTETSLSEQLAPLVRQTLQGWHAFVATGNSDLLAPLLSEHIVFRSPFVQSPIPGRPATLLVLTTVVQIFENFRYHREFVAGSHDAALEFSANIGKWHLKGIDLIKFDADGTMIEFEVMVRPIKALQVLGEEMGNRIGPELTRLKAAAAGP